VKDADVLSSQYMGELVVSFNDLIGRLDQDNWFQIQNLEDPSGARLLGDLGVCVSIRGPGSDSCPKCALFLGEAESMLVKKSRFHAYCVSCERCRTLLKENDYLERSNRFYCHRDFERLFGSVEYNDVASVTPPGLLIPSPLDTRLHHVKPSK